MSRNPELDKLLREVDSLTSEKSAPQPETPRVEQHKREGSSFLKSIGGFFISKVEDEETTAPVEIDEELPQSQNTVAEVALNEPAPDFSDVAASGEDLASKDFHEIYSAAGIDESGFTVDKLASLLNDATLKDQPVSTKTLVVKMALKAQNIEPEVPVTDAVRRDRALDVYQQMLNDRAAAAETENTARVQAINDEIRRYLEQKNREMDELRSQTQELKRQAETFAARRQAEEKRLAETIVPLLEGKPNPVTQ